MVGLHSGTWMQDLPRILFQARSNCSRGGPHSTSPRLDAPDTTLKSGGIPVCLLSPAFSPSLGCTVQRSQKADMCLVSGLKKKCLARLVTRIFSQSFSPLPRHGESWLSSQASPVPGTSLAQHTNPIVAWRQSRVYGIPPRRRGPCSYTTQAPLHSSAPEGLGDLPPGSDDPLAFLPNCSRVALPPRYLCRRGGSDYGPRAPYSLRQSRPRKIVRPPFFLVHPLIYFFTSLLPWNTPSIPILLLPLPHPALSTPLRFCSSAACPPTSYFHKNYLFSFYNSLTVRK